MLRQARGSKLRQMVKTRERGEEREGESKPTEKGSFVACLKSAHKKYSANSQQGQDNAVYELYFEQIYRSKIRLAGC